MTGAPEATQQMPHWQRPKVQSVSLPQGLSTLAPVGLQKYWLLFTRRDAGQQAGRQPSVTGRYEAFAEVRRTSR